MKLYRIKNSKYEEKQVAAEDMGEALDKYRKYLREHINSDYSDYDVYIDGRRFRPESKIAGSRADCVIWLKIKTEKP